MKPFNQFFTDQIRTLNEGLYDRLSHYMTEPLKVGRNVIRGYPVDVDDTPTPDTGLTMTAVDRDAAKGLAAELRSAGFKVTVTRGVDLLVTEGTVPDPNSDDEDDEEDDLNEAIPPGWDDNLGWRGPSKEWFPHGKKPDDKKPVKEELPPDATAADWVNDFVHSKNKEFEGKSEKERIRMALGAYYASKQKNEGWVRFMLEDAGDIAVTEMGGTWVIYDPDWELVFDHNNENWVPKDNLMSSGYPGFPTREEASKYLDNAKRTMHSDEL